LKIQQPHSFQITPVTVGFYSSVDLFCPVERVIIFF